MDAHVFARPTLNLYLKLFSFTNAMMLCTGYAANSPVSSEAFSGLNAFLRDGAKIDENRLQPAALAIDFQALPQVMFQNLNSFPKLFVMFQPESYHG